ncbi:kinase-like protein [Lentinus brumalis]|uniref:Kinase-like protein n=1 Tax=Lentinus brumalis TaxID=2498619 RepID=A0A371D8G9_9APHY|nr:kinase-like protein [Polyporus brumalis]
MQDIVAQESRDVPRPHLPAVFPESAWRNGELLDGDQAVSAALGLSLSPPPLPLLALSEPSSSSLFSGSPVASPLPVDEIDLASSPAAMFLSAFSPTVSEHSLAPDDEGATVAGYTLGPVVGRGGFSIIRSASSSQGGAVAVKIVRRSDLDKQPDPALARKSLEREAEVWSSLNHEHILPLFTVTHTPYADFFFTSYCPAGSLFDILKRDGRPALPQDDAGMMFRQVVRGLRYMHEVAGYVHGDLKLENVLVDEMGVCKIGDFGMSRKIGDIDDDVESDDEEAEFGREKVNILHRSRTISQANLTHMSFGRQAGKLPHALSLMRRHGVPARHRTSSPFPASGTPPAVPNRGFAPGSLPYAAPELLLSPSNTTPYAANPAQDIWALGVMLYTLLTGKLPFSDSFEPRLQMKILHGVFEMPQGIGRSAEQVLRGCIERSVPNRWTVAMVDEVAWGIGWGSAADDVSPPPEATVTISASRSRSRSLAKGRQDTVVDDTSRAQSRAARSSSRSTSAMRSASRSHSRPPHHPYDHAQPYPHPLLHTESHPVHPPRMQPSLSSLTNAILRTSSTMSSDSSSPHSSAIILQPSFSGDSDIAQERERGRLPRARLRADASVSRSRSPPEMPVTPRDMSMDVAVRRHKSPPARPSLSTPELEHPISQLDTLDEDSRWQFSPSMDDESTAARSLSRFTDESSGFRSSSARGRRFSSSREELRKVIRNESMPPVLSPSHSSAWRLPAVGTSGRTTGGLVPATPIAIPGACKSARSQSLGPAYSSRHAT